MNDIAFIKVDNTAYYYTPITKGLALVIIEQCSTIINKLQFTSQISDLMLSSGIISRDDIISLIFEGN